MVHEDFQQRELAARQRRYDRRAVCDDELALVLAVVERVNQARHELLARAAVASYEHGGIREAGHLDDVA